MSAIILYYTRAYCTRNFTTSVDNISNKDNSDVIACDVCQVGWFPKSYVKLFAPVEKSPTNSTRYVVLHWVTLSCVKNKV